MDSVEGADIAGDCMVADQVGQEESLGRKSGRRGPCRALSYLPHVGCQLKLDAACLQYHELPVNGSSLLIHLATVMRAEPHKPGGGQGG